MVLGIKDSEEMCEPRHCIYMYMVVGVDIAVITNNRKE